MLRVAAVQMQPEPLDLHGNLARVLDLARRAAAREARLVVFPEIGECVAWPWKLDNLI